MILDPIPKFGGSSGGGGGGGGGVFFVGGGGGSCYVGALKIMSLTFKFYQNQSSGSLENQF